MTDKERAKAAYKAVCDFLDEAKLKYQKDDAENVAFISITGDDFPVTLMFAASEEKQRIETYSKLPFEIKKEKAVDLAMAIAAINNRIAYGKFVLYIEKDQCTYENSEYLTGLEGFGVEYGRTLVAPAYAVIEEYNDKLYAISKGLLTVKDFLASLNK